MARLARGVAPGCAHHVTQRGNRRQRTFFSDEDCRACVGLMADRWRRHESTGRALGTEAFVAALAQSDGRGLRPQKRGPKPTRTQR